MHINRHRSEGPAPVKHVGISNGGGRKSRSREMKPAVEEEEKKEREVCWARLRSIMAFSRLVCPALLPVGPRGLLPVWLFGVLNPSLFSSSLWWWRVGGGGGCKEWQVVLIKPLALCPNAKTTQCFDLLPWVLSSRPGCIVNMPAKLYCLIMRVLFYMRTVVSRGAH